jgi:hypothetical protein
MKRLLRALKYERGVAMAVLRTYADRRDGAVADLTERRRKWRVCRPAAAARSPCTPVFRDGKASGWVGKQEDLITFPRQQDDASVPGFFTPKILAVFSIDKEHR